MSSRRSIRVSVTVSYVTPAKKKTTGRNGLASAARSLVENGVTDECSDVSGDLDTAYDKV